MTQYPLTMDKIDELEHSLDKGEMKPFTATEKEYIEREYGDR